MKKTVMIFISLYAAFAFVACQKSKKSGSSNTPAPQVGCPAGTTFQNGYCVNGNQIVGTGAAGFNSEYNFGRYSMTMSNQGVYKLFLKEAFSICDRDGYNSGLSGCDAYASGYSRLTLQAISPTSTTIRLTMEAVPQTYNMYGGFYGWYNVSLPTAGQAASCGLMYLMTGYCMTYYTTGQMSVPRNPLVLDMAVSPINSSQGFEARSYGAWGTVSQNKLVQFQVSQGKLSDNYFGFRLIYDGTRLGEFARGQMNRCGNTVGASCGY